MVKKVICVCCSSDLTDKPSNRFNLLNPTFSNLRNTWNVLVEETGIDIELADQLLQADQTVTVDGTSVTGRVCRPCGGILKKLNKMEKLKETIKADIHSTISKLYEPVSIVEEDTESSLPLLPIKRQGSPLAPSKSTKRLRYSTSSPVTIIVKSKHYTLPQRLKQAGKSLARGSSLAIAKACLNDQKIRDKILLTLGKEMKKELRSMTSTVQPSILRSNSLDDLRNFKWNIFYEELHQKTPTILYFFKSLTETKTPRNNNISLISFCMAIILKYRFPHMSLVHKIISLILYEGHCSKFAIQRLCTLGICVSYTTVNKLINLISQGHDNIVIKWRDELISLLNSSTSMESTTTIHQHMIQSADQSDQELESEIESENDDSQADSSICVTDNDTDSESVPSPIFSPILCSNHDDYSSGEEVTDTETLPFDDEEEIILKEPHHQHITTMSIDNNLINSQPAPVFSFKLVGDNIDKNVTPRYIRPDKTVQSFHYYHSFAVQSRINIADIPKEKPPSCIPSPTTVAKSLVPSKNDDDVLISNIKILFSRILVDTLPFFKNCFSDIICQHITHRRYEEMSKPSIVVPLGILPKNENKIKEMEEILSHLHQYVPQIEYLKNVESPVEPGVTIQLIESKTHHILLGGDQLSQARACSAMKSKANSESPKERLEGLVPTVEDWHTKLTLFEVIWKYFVKQESSSDHGTAYQIRNVLGRSNVVLQPKKNMNACEDFFKSLIKGYMTYATMVHLKINEVDECPTSFHELEFVPEKEKRRKVLDDILSGIVKEFVDIRYNEIESSEPSKQDVIFSYAKQLLSIGCIYLEFNDAIKEGDGERVLRCWRYLMIIFHNANRKNYALEAVRLTYQLEYQLPPHLKEEILYSRFINVQGYPGRNIPLDLHMEHLNKEVKAGIEHLGPNKTKNALIRLGKVLGTLSPILSNYDTVNNITNHHTRHKPPSDTKDVYEIVKTLKNTNVFNEIDGRKYNFFKNTFTSLLRKKKEQELLTWMTTHL